ncbi:MAG: hypothetical protein L6R40_000393 [Gallowayella cf. fulva]|nr:MAG: hypothetical protein L6R40_000393 [Xanthomendoza cf. fulva]
MTRADRGARTQRTTKGKKSKSKKKSKRKPTRATRDDEEEQATDALDSSNPGELPTAVSSATDAPAQPSEPDVNVQAESDGNTGRLADDGSTAIQESPKLPPQEPTTDQDEAAEGHANALATRTRDALINAASAALSRPGRGSSPAPNENRGEPSSAAPPSNMVRIVTYPNGLSQPPLIQYTTSPAPIPTTTTTPRGHRAASPAPEDHFRRSRSPSAPPRELPPPTTLLPNPLEQTVNLPRLPLPPTPDRPGLALQPPSRDHSPSEDPVLVVHQPPGFGYLVPRVGGYREGSIDRWPVLPDRRLRQMSDAGLEVRGETIYWKRAEGEEEEEEVEGEEEDMDIDGDEEMEMEEVGGQDGVEQREMKGIEEDESEESEVGDPANMTLEELDEMMKDF